jgi:PAS domain S-box-containing protein
MNTVEFQLRGVSDPRLAAHASSALPAWLWSTDGTHVPWANPVGAQVFGATDGASLAKKIFGPADMHRRQVAQLAHRLAPTGAIRLERLRGFGATLGMLITCFCARLEFAEGSEGILIVTAEPVGRSMPLAERLRHLTEGIDSPVAAFLREGMLVAASNAARSLLGGLVDLSDASLAQAHKQALGEGRSETPLGRHRMVLHRVGIDADTGLIAIIEREATAATHAGHMAASSPTEAAPAPTTPTIAPPGEVPLPEYERPAISGEAPAEFALIDEFTEREATPDTPAAEPVLSETPSESVRLEENREQSSFEAEAGLEPAPSSNAEPPQPMHPPALPSIAQHAPFEPAAEPRRYPLRFMWQMDADGRFSISRDEFTHLIGVNTAAALGRPWGEIAETFALDPEGRVGKAIATRSTWSGVILQWPVDGGSRLRIEMSGLPIYDHVGNFTGYRGFGVCRDLDELASLEAQRRLGPSEDRPTKVAVASAAALADSSPPTEAPPAQAIPPVAAVETAAVKQNNPDKPAEAAEDPLNNVVPFRPVGEGRAPVLTSVENSAFSELARQLSARLEGEHAAEPATEASAGSRAAASESGDNNVGTPNWLAHPEPPPRGESGRDRMLLDLLPDGVLIYRLDRLLYANRAFLERIGYPSLHALEQAGGLDALYVEPGVSNAASTSDTGTPVIISVEETSDGSEPESAIEARLHTISWDGESAHALIFAGSGLPGGGVAASGAAVSGVAASPGAAPAAPVPSAVGHADAEELGAILDTTADGILMFDAEGNINSCNRSAEALFGHDGSELVKRNLASLLAPESQGAVLDYLASLKGSGVASLLEHGREVLAFVRGGGLIPLSMTMGRTQARGPNFFAVFGDLSQTKKNEDELREARRLADRAANARADLVARISHEIRTPLNAIIGFAEVMIGERFGALGNERYAEYMKDIRACGERVIALIDELADHSQIETGRLDLAFTPQDLNEVVENCVSAMQPQANRQRIIIRTSLAQALPPIVADADALRQIAQNLIGNSIHLTNAGGQMIVSTALTDFGEVVLRVRDTGQGLNDDEVAAALEPFRTQPPADQADDGSPVSLSLTKALVEANRAKFHIRTAAGSGTLIEVVFSHSIVE